MQQPLLKIIRLMVLTTSLCLSLSIVAGQALANEAEVVAVKVSKTGNETWRFDVTLRHGDTGWEHYANAWEVRTLTGELLGKRVLHHPHVDEQPFRRSLSGIKIPKDIRKVLVRGHDLVHKYGGQTCDVTLP